MAQGRDLRRAIDRLVADLTRVAERVIATEVERAIMQATARIDRRSTRSASVRAVISPTTTLSRAERAAQRRAEREKLRAERLAAREADRAERQAARERRKQEREQLKQELLSAREAARQARDSEKGQQRSEKSAAREAAQKARAAELTPPPLVVFKRSRDGQVTVLQPRPVDTEAPPPSA